MRSEVTNIVTKSYEAEVLDDGHLSLAEEVRREFDLKSGDRVEVTIQRPPVSAALDPDNPLVKLIGLCRGSGKTDSALRHDHYLYHEDQPWMVFVDTGGWIAVTEVSDSFHKVAETYYVDLLSRRVRLFTSNYILDETITRIRYDFSHVEACRFCDLYEQAAERHLVTTLWVDEKVAQEALQIFRKYSDQDFSFTDCTSFVLMQRHSLKEAFTFDSHFETFGFLRYPRVPLQK